MSSTGKTASIAVVAVLLLAPALPGQGPSGGKLHLGTNPNAPVLIEVFSDHQCPACKRFFLEVARPVVAEFGARGQVTLVYHDYPLPAHEHSRQAARYTQAAGKLGQRQWMKVTEALYSMQEHWSADGKMEDIVAQALTPGEMSQVRRWMNAPEIEARINEEIRQGQQRGVRSTPTIFITARGKTETIPSQVQYPILRRYIEHLLRQ